MDLAFTPEEERFRAELRTWLGAHLPAGWTGHRAFATLADEVAFLRDWQRTLAGDRWVGIHWPREYGGRGASVVEHYVFQEEIAAARAPEIINRIGVNLVGPTLIAHGTEQQKRRFLPEIMPAEELWCQLFSEPGAGSDLTSLRTRAERRGDGMPITVPLKGKTGRRKLEVTANTTGSPPREKAFLFLTCKKRTDACPAPGTTTTTTTAVSTTTTTTH